MPEVLAPIIGRQAHTEDVRRINPLVPVKGIIGRIIKETPDTRTYCISGLDGKVPFHLKPGQVAMLSLLGVGEGMFSAVDAGDHLQFSIKKVGKLTKALHEAEEGETVGVRGPYGNGFPLEFIRGKDLLLVAGGIGLAPIRSLIRHCLQHRGDYAGLHLVYGARTPSDLVFKEEILKLWPAVEDFRITITVDQKDEQWQGNVGFVSALLDKMRPAPGKRVCIICGPPAMIRLSLAALERQGFAAEDVITTLEMRMKCGIGQCGRCNIGSCYVCLDGPVFSLADLKKYSSEY